ncbi:T-cell-specific surface glycoprotein CD28 [Aulostomus maculatus]
MSVCWVFLILLGTSLFQSLRTCDCKYKLTTACVHTGDALTVPCPELAGEEVTLFLLKDEQVVYNHTCNFGDQKLSYRLNTSAGIGLRAFNKSASFFLTGEAAGNPGVYWCEVAVRFPPPYRKITSAFKHMVHVLGHQCKCGHQDSSKPQPPSTLWIWIPVVALLFTYSVVITVSAAVFWVKLSRNESQNDYINTKPRATNAHKRRRGLQNV